jgi:hypothetical protein
MRRVPAACSCAGGAAATPARTTAPAPRCRAGGVDAGRSAGCCRSAAQRGAQRAWRGAGVWRRCRAMCRRVSSMRRVPAASQPRRRARPHQRRADASMPAAPGDLPGAAAAPRSVARSASGAVLAGAVDAAAAPAASMISAGAAEVPASMPCDVPCWRVPSMPAPCRRVQLRRRRRSHDSAHDRASAALPRRRRRCQAMCQALPQRRAAWRTARLARAGGAVDAGAMPAGAAAPAAPCWRVPSMPQLRRRRRCRRVQLQPRRRARPRQRRADASMPAAPGDVPGAAVAWRSVAHGASGGCWRMPSMPCDLPGAAAALAGAVAAAAPR